MTAYLRWSVRQFYYLLFQPTAFERENHTLEQGFLAKPLARSVYLAKLVPGTLILSSLVLLTVGWRWEESHGHFSWTLASVGILVGIASGIAFGALFGVGFGITTSLGSSIACSLNIGFTGGMPGAMIMGLGLGSAVGLTTRFHPGLVIGGIIGLIGTTDHSLNHGVAAGARSSVFYFATFGVSFFLVRYRLLDFPLHAFLDWLGCRGLRNDLSQAPRRWARHPLAWNETIHLPLPCAREFLSLLVQYDRDFGFQKIAFVAAERPRQRRAAGAALEEIALNDLAVQSAGDFTRTGRALAWLTQPPAALPELLTELIPHFVRAAQFMAQGQALSGRFRQLEAVENAQSELAGIRTHLIGRPGELGPRLLRRANDWTTLIEAEHRRLKSLAVVEPEIPQVFRFGNPVREDESYVFAGRGKLVHELEAVLLGDARPPASRTGSRVAG